MRASQRPYEVRCRDGREGDVDVFLEDQRRATINLAKLHRRAAELERRGGGGGEGEEKSRGKILSLNRCNARPPKLGELEGKERTNSFSFFWFRFRFRFFF